MSSVSRLAMRRAATLARTIHSLPEGAGSGLKTLNPAIPFCLQSRPCEWCKQDFLPVGANGFVRFCSKPCQSKYHEADQSYREVVGQKRKAWLTSGNPKAVQEIERIRQLNPMSNKATVEKMIEVKTANGTLRQGLGENRGGNGTGLTVPQKRLFEVLEPGWTPELAIPLGGRFPGYPTNYKVDLGNQTMRLAIELDGRTHSSQEQKEKDKKKDIMLGSLGWTVLRFTNKMITDWMDLGMQMESYVSTTFKQHGVLLLVSQDW